LRSIDDVSSAVASGQALFLIGSKTSTVIPFEKMEAALGDFSGVIGDLSLMPPSIELNDNGDMKIAGAVSWKDARDFCWSKGREVMTSPTEELALVLSGLATSCTGERCFGLGTLRDQVVSLKYMGADQKVHELHADRPLKNSPLFKDHLDLLSRYQDSFERYRPFKNAPFPRLEMESDLMIGFEGQLGVITEAVLKTRKSKDLTYIFIVLPKWETDLKPHLELFQQVQKVRDRVISCELIDENSWKYLPASERPVVDRDTVFLEVESEHFDSVYHDLLSQLTLVDADSMFEMNATKCRELRVKVPRAIFEVNSRMGVTKKGTDAQSGQAHFEDMMKLYQDWSKRGVDYNLFGHFGDGHLHFNFMPTKEKDAETLLWLEELYRDIAKWGGSPFAEHGVGLLKQKFMSAFYQPVHHEMFHFLKQKLDPKNIFFPMGFMQVGVK